MMDERMGKISVDAFENLARASIAQDKEIDALRAELAQAQETIAMWQQTGNAIMKAAFGKPAPLSDSEICWLITELRAQCVALRAKLDAVPVEALRRYWQSSTPTLDWYDRDDRTADCASIQLWLGTTAT